MNRRAYTNPKDIAEVEALSKLGYSVERPINSHGDEVAGTWLVEGWLFIWPKNQKYGERYRQVYGYYKRGRLKEFVELAMENKFKKQDIFFGKDNLEDEVLI